MTLQRQGRTARALWTLAILSLIGLVLPVGTTSAQSDSLTFPETGKTLRGVFLRYWTYHPHQGAPISDEMQERSDIDGKTYTVQYFERAVLELHPENQQPYDVLLSLLGVSYYSQRYPEGAPGQEPCMSPDSVLFPQTGKRLGCTFLDYWQRNGGLMQFGYPISDEFMEESDADGQPRRVQYFERAVLAYNNEAIARFDSEAGYVLEGRLGMVRLSAKSGSRQVSAFAPPQPRPHSPSGCEVTFHGPSETDPPWPDPPLRASVGQGLVVSGTIRSGEGCSPIAGAKLAYVLAGPDGQYDDEHQGAVLTGSSGGYRFETNFPGYYGAGGPHIHLYITAEGYRPLEAEIFAACGQTGGTFDIVLAPAR
ncbi:MAG TPA: hypothetical protein VGE04_16970 [Chloroflexia bacterium]|jgi:hypothetical protein